MRVGTESIHQEPAMRFLPVWGELAGRLSLTGDMGSPFWHTAIDWESLGKKVCVGGGGLEKVTDQRHDSLFT